MHDVDLFLPPRDTLLTLQREEGRPFCSAASLLIWRKHGVVPPAEGSAEDGPAIVARETPWQDTFRDRPLLFEGPLHPSVARELSIDVIEHTSERLKLRGAEGRGLGTLAIDRPTVRRIPERFDERSDPYPFRSDDGLWNSDAFRYQTLAGGDAVLWAGPEGDEVVGVRRGPALVLGAPLLDLIVRHHTPPPYDEGYYALEDAAQTEAVEAWLLEQWTALAEESAAVEVRVDRWPVGCRAAITVRHDVDRPFGRRGTAWLLALLAFYERSGVKATWFWRRCTSRSRRMRALMQWVQRRSHEVALHTEARDERAFVDDELGHFRRQLDLQALGFTAHGGPPSPGYLGMRQLTWAQRASLLYGERLGGISAVPSQVALMRDGVPELSTLVVPGDHLSLDAGLGPEQHLLADVRRDASATLAAGGHCVVMNHPDIHVRQLVALLNGLDLDGVWRATHAEVCAFAVATRAASVWAKEEDRVVLRFGGALPAPASVEVRVGGRSLRRVAPAGATSLEVALD